LKDKIESVKQRISQAAQRCGRNAENILLAAVTKTVSADRIRQAAEAGITIVGENYIQEAKEKFEQLTSCNLSWHFIGHLQTNKAKYAVSMFDLIHSVDSLKLAQELSRQAAKLKKIQNILIQVNISQEESKSGISEEAALELVESISRLENVSIKGLMTMPPFFDNPEQARPYFACLRRLSEKIKQYNIPNISMSLLSMGMTGDFETAIEEGATIVRIGTAIFGKRN